MTADKRGPRVHRMTLFKIPDETNQKRLLDAYHVVAEEQKKLASQKDGKPYILQLTAGKTMEDQKARGYTVASYIEFASMDDMRYYDNECLAHAMLKEIGPSLNMSEPPTILCFEKSNLAAAQDSS
ncbi:stress responsive A/B barrel domain-protein [Pseudoneurospora amorphoporcata]|uniref:Stress responsive A/B barrel domain-protein n=1 Tax=Pseudoneurospora amorphoporcata TaxID=241081 RepID=A0AAN6SK44_9PEZI|nr:stress responsive A/B barrel domain-protein [Pseudoneurospora amorphoporcata]